MDKGMAGKAFLCGSEMTLADVVCFVNLMGCFQTVLDAGFRKGQKNLGKWADAMCGLQAVKNVFGNI